MPNIFEIASADLINQLAGPMFSEVEAIITANLGAVFPATSITVVRDGEVLLNQAWGELDPATNRVMARPDMLFDLASITKVYTVTTLLTLLNANQIELKSPLVDIIPEFGESGLRSVDGGQDPHTKMPLPTPAEYENLKVDPAQVTLWHLLTHTSGLAPWRDVFNVAGPAPVPPTEPERVSRYDRWDRALPSLFTYSFVGEPDAVVRYSDIGLMLLGEVVRRLAGRELDTAIAAHVLQPLALSSMTFNPLRSGRDRLTIHPTEIDSTWRQRRIWGDVHDENASGVGGVAGHAGLFGTARDVAALGQAWLNEDQRVGIPPPIMQLAKQEHAVTGAMRRGLGWQLKARAGANAGDLMSPSTFGHTGFTGNSLWIDPEQALVIVVLTNWVYYGRETPGLYEFRRAIHDALVRAVYQL